MKQWREWRVSRLGGVDPAQGVDLRSGFWLARYNNAVGGRSHVGSGLVGGGRLEPPKTFGRKERDTQLFHQLSM